MSKRKDPAITGKLYAPVPVSTLEEEWRDVVGHKGLYLISSQGRLYSVVREFFFRPALNSRGYLRTVIGRNTEKERDVRIHVLVAEAFVGPRPNGYGINHKNGIKTDNRASNLEYATQSENVKHAYATGLRKLFKGENASGAKLSAKDVLDIREEWSKRTKRKDGVRGKLAEKYGIAPEHVWQIATGRAWKELY